MIKCIFRFENLDSTKDLNQRSEHLFKKGIYYGGKVTIDNENVSSVKVPPFRLISHDGMHVLSDETITLPINVGNYYILCKAKYVIDDSPDVNVLSIDDNTFNSLSDEEKLEYVVFAHVTSNGISITNLSIQDYKEEITQVGRDINRGYFESEQELNEIEAFEGDFATVKSDNSSEILPYIYNGTEWVSFPNNRIFDVRLTNHKNNKDINVSNSLKIVSDSNKNKGAYHINWNQLNSLKNLEYNDNGIIEDELTVYYNEGVQAVHFPYKIINANISETYNLRRVESLSELDYYGVNSYYVDLNNSVLYIWIDSRIQSCEVQYSYTFKEKQVVTEIEFNKIPRPSELEALKGNDYGINFTERFPSNTNRYITSKSPVPKKVASTFTSELINGNYYLVTNETKIFVGSSNHTKYFEVIDTENGLPINVSEVKVRRIQGSSVIIDDINAEDLYSECWFVRKTDTKLALKVEALGNFTASSINGSKNVYYHIAGGLGEIDSCEKLDYLTNQNYEKILLKAKSIAFDTIFNISDYRELSINSALFKCVNHNTNISTKINEEISFLYGSHNIGTIYASRSNNKSYLFINVDGTESNDGNLRTLSSENTFIEAMKDLSLIGHKDVSLKSAVLTDVCSEVYLSPTSSQLKTTYYNQHAQLTQNLDNNEATISLEAVSDNHSTIYIHAFDKDEGPVIKIEQNNLASSQFEKGVISLYIHRIIGQSEYTSIIEEKADDIEIITRSTANYSKSISTSSRISLENSESNSNVDTKRVSNVIIRKDSIALTTTYGTVDYSKYLSEDDKITIENGEVETSENVGTRKFSEIEIQKDSIFLGTRHGAVYVDASIELSEGTISTYSSTFSIHAESTDANEYGIEINSSANNKGIIIGTASNTNYVEVSIDKVKIVSNNSLEVTTDNNISLETSKSSVSLANKLTISNESQGINVEVTSDSSSRADIKVSNNYVYLSTYNYSSNSFVPYSSISLGKTSIDLFIGSSSSFKVTETYIESKVNDTVNNKNGSIKLDYGNGIKLEYDSHTYTNSIELNGKVDVKSTNEVELYAYDSSGNRGSVLIRKDSLSLASNKSTSATTYSKRFVIASESSGSSVISIGIEEGTNGEAASSIIKMLILGGNLQPESIPQGSTTHICRRFAVIIGSTTYYIPLVLAQ